ncbi:MAG: hypothetical protein FWC24_01890 [Treponema sp.]|nr:hypothetical protein [Treponema sp.]
MPQMQTMTDIEKIDTAYKAAMLGRGGDHEGSERLIKTIPLPPYLAQIAKEKIGMDFLLNGGWNLSEAEAKFGPDFFSK